MCLFPQELAERERILTEKEAVVAERDVLEAKRLRSSQAAARDLLHMSLQLDSIEDSIRLKEEEMRGQYVCQFEINTTHPIVPV